MIDHVAAPSSPSKQAADQDADQQRPGDALRGMSRDALLRLAEQLGELVGELAHLALQFRFLRRLGRRLRSGWRGYRRSGRSRGVCGPLRLCGRELVLQ